MKNQNGITLIALVITIIVLLILAGVAIAMLSGDNGILNKATQSSYKTAIATAQDQINLEASELIADYYEHVYVNDVDYAVTTGAPEGTTELQDYVAQNLTAVAADDAKATTTYDNVTYTFTKGEHTILVKYTADVAKYSTGTIGTDGKITWVDTFPAE